MMRSRGTATIIAVLLLMQFSLGQLFNTAVAVAAGTASPCHDVTPAKYLPDSESVAVPPDSTLAVAAAAKIGSAGDTERASRDLAAGTPSTIAAERARKDVLNATITNHGSMSILADRATLKRECGLVTASFPSALQRLVAATMSSAEASYGTGYRWLDWMNQQGQLYTTWCGPATVSEMANTMKNNGRLTNPVAQGTAATSMGTNGDGTSVNNEVAGINQYVAQPIVHSNYYLFVWLSGSTNLTTHANEMNTFESNLDYDLRNGWAIGGDGWETPYGLHLVGHPANLEIKHWFQVGGYQSSGASTYYSDSATTIWSGVQPFSWYNTSDLVYIFGGFGYAW